MTNARPLGDRPDSLHVDYHYIRRRIGRYLEYGYNHATWDDNKRETVQEVIDEGVRQYYFPPPLPYDLSAGPQQVHVWSFMRPIHRFVTVAGQKRYQMPPDFDRPLSDITYVDEEQGGRMPIKWTSPARLLKMEYRDDWLSHPHFAAIEPAEATGMAPHEQVIALAPVPDAEYPLAFQYNAIAKRLTEDNPYPLGGQVHGEGILASCLAVAEILRVGGEGALARKFREVLTGNILRDQHRGAQLLGYNGNDSSHVVGRGMARRMGLLFYNNVTYGE
jgi:hypothetical protein